MLNISNVKVPRRSIIDFIERYDETEMKEMMLSLNEKDAAVYFINELQSLIEKVSQNRIPILIRTFIKYTHSLTGRDPYRLFDADANIQAGYYVFDLLKRIKNKDDSYELLKDIIISGNVFELYEMAKIIKRIERAYGRISESQSQSREEDMIITDGHLREIEGLYLERLNKLGRALMETGQLWEILNLWMYLDNDGAKAAVKKMTPNMKYRLKFICCCAGRWLGSRVGGWSYNLEFLQEFVDIDKAYKYIMKVGNVKLDNFSKDELAKLMTFCYKYMYRNDHDLPIYKAEEMAEAYSDGIVSFFDDVKQM